MTVMAQEIFTRKRLIEYLLQHEKDYPEMDDFYMEMRAFLLAAPPVLLKHDERDRVVILAGVVAH